MSRSLVKPVDTPCTALATRLRASPCKAACSSFSRTVTRCPSFFSTLMPAGSCVSSDPLGPLTRTPSGVTLMSTPLGTAIILFPILDINSPNLLFRVFTRASELGPRNLLLPDLAQDLAADIFLARGAPGHQTLGRGQNVDAHPSQYARHFRAADVDAAAGARNALDARNDRLVVGAVLQTHLDALTRAVLDEAETGDVAFVAQDGGHLQF